MTDKRFDAIIFDVGGVLIDCDPRYLYAEHFEDESDLNYFLAHVCSDAWNRKQDNGRDVWEATRELAAAHPQHARHIEMFYACFDRMIAGTMPDMVPLLDALLSGSVPLYGLTNWPAATFPLAMERLPQLARFTDILISSTVGLLKPDPAIFKLALSRFSLDGSRTLFIDDHRPNVLGARAAGLRAARFVGAPALHRLLAKHSLVP